MFGLGLLGLCVLFASFTKYASRRETEKPRRLRDFARMLHEEGIPSVRGGRMVRRRGTTVQLTKDECAVFFAAFSDSVVQLLGNSESVYVLYLGRAKGDSPTPYPIFNIVSAGIAGPLIDPTPFSPSTPSVQGIADKYDAITVARETP